MRNKNNVNYYIQRKIDRELEKNINSIIEKRIRQINFDRTMKDIVLKNNRKTANEFHNSLFRDNIKKMANIDLFGASNSQFLDAFSGELRRSIFRNL